MFKYFLFGPLIVFAASVSVNTNFQNTSVESINEEISEVFGASSTLMIQVSFCESSTRQYEKNGKILHGEVNKDDIGVFQINIDAHKDEILATTTDIYTADGNIHFAKYLFDRDGIKDWSNSEKCWSKPGNSG